jgi:tRNA/tmRNA/rRNA uracil-C5-methylase (TrmA/RlmC/RlmD family)
VNQPAGGEAVSVARESLVGEVLELAVGPVAHGGHCVARSEGRVVFVRHTLPGERVRAVVTEGHAGARFLRADAVEVLAAVPDRVPAPCPYAGPGCCGGCDWQHVTLDGQRRLKAAVVAEQLARLPGLELPVIVEPAGEGDLVADGLGWRTRVRFAVDSEGRAGLRRHRSHEVVPIDRCLIAHAGVERLGVESGRWPPGAVVEVTASATTGESLVLVDGRVDERAEGRGRGSAVVHERAAGRTWRVTGAGFWQVHPAAADMLVDAVLTGLRPARGETALDLYAGVGLFAGALAGRVGRKGRVVAVEHDRRAAADARRNLSRLPQAKVEVGRVDRVLRRLPPDSYDLAVLDPPRAGAGRAVVDLLAGRGARVIAYVACDPAALARDVAYFAEHGYSLTSLRAFDLFPMTHHVECVAILQRR